MQCNQIQNSFLGILVYQHHHKFPNSDDLPICSIVHVRFVQSKIGETWTESCWAMLVAQRQAALSSVSFGSLPQGQADTAADTRKGEQSKLRMDDQSNTEANATTSALLLPILLWFHLCKQCSGVLSMSTWRCCNSVRCQQNIIFLRVVWTGGNRSWSGHFPVWSWVLLLRPCPSHALLCLF